MGRLVDASCGGLVGQVAGPQRGRFEQPAVAQVRDEGQVAQPELAEEERLELTAVSDVVK